MSNDTQHTVRESGDKIRLKTKIKRGTGTRDQDEIEVKVRGDDPTECVAKLNQTVDLLRDTSDTLREIQTGEDE